MKEPEEVLEIRLVDLIAVALPSLDVLGALSPALPGEQKNSPDTYVSVFVDLASQDLDWRGPGVPCSYSVRVTVHISGADDATGALFRDSCRTVRDALYDLTGDGCSGLDGDGFSCDAFMLESTSTALDGDSDNGGMAKTYNATVQGRYNNNKED